MKNENNVSETPKKGNTFAWEMHFHPMDLTIEPLLSPPSRRNTITHPWPVPKSTCSDTDANCYNEVSHGLPGPGHDRWWG